MTITVVAARANRGQCSDYRLASAAIADGDTQPRGVIATEFKIVADEIEVSFRLYEEAVKGVKLDSSSDVPEQMVGAGKVSAGEEGARHKRLIETDALAAQSAFKVGGRMLAY